MATRVRKLARELRRTPAEVLGILHQLGYLRYRSSEDQLSDIVVERVREAARQGGPVTPVTPRDHPRASRGAATPAADDWMAKLIPGVVRREREEHELGPGAARPRPARPEPARPEPDRGEPARHQPDLRGEAAAATPAAAPASDARIDAARARLEAERAELETARAELTAARARLEQAQRELTAARDQVEAIRVELEQERVALDEARSAGVPGAVSFSELLEERGLRGSDEQQRALGVLAAGRHLGAVLPDLRVLDAARARRILDDRLVLVAGEVPASLHGVAAVTVAPDRAELPDARELSRLLGEVSEQLLLNGLRRLVVVNAAPRWQKTIREGLDRRVEVSFRPLPAPYAEPGLGRSDAVVLWRAELPDAQRRAWAEAAGRLVSVAEPDLGTFLSRLKERLRG